MAKCLRFYQTAVQGLMPRVLFEARGAATVSEGYIQEYTFHTPQLAISLDLGRCLSSQLSLLVKILSCTLGCVEASVTTDDSCIRRGPAAGMGLGGDLHTGICPGAGHNMFAKS